MFRKKYEVYNKYGQIIEAIADQILEDFAANRIGGILWRGYTGGAQALLNLRPYRSAKQDLVDVINVYKAIGHNDRDNSWCLLEDASWDWAGELTGYVRLEFHDSNLILSIQK